MFSLPKKWIQHLKRYGLAFSAVEILEDIKYRYNTHLKNKYYKRKIEETAQEVGPGLFVGGESYVNSNTVLGDNVHFMGLEIPEHDEGPVTIGDNFHSGSGCYITTLNHDYDNGDAIPYGETYVCESVDIEDNVWLGRDVTVIPGVTIEEGAIIQSNSVVTQDIPKGAIAGGHPAEVFKQRDMEHYETLKAEGKFN